MDKRKGFLIEDILLKNNKETETNVFKTGDMEKLLESNDTDCTSSDLLHPDRNLDSEAISPTDICFKTDKDSFQDNVQDKSHSIRCSNTDNRTTPNNETQSGGNLSLSHFSATTHLLQPTNQHCSPICRHRPEHHLARLLQYHPLEQQPQTFPDLFQKHNQNATLHLARLAHHHPHHYPHAPKTRKRDKKMRRPRTNFSDQQLRELEGLFVKQKYLNVQERTELADKLGLNEMQIKTWYQNRRTKWKRQTQLGLDILSQRNLYQNTDDLYQSSNQTPVPTAFSLIKPNPISLNDVIGSQHASTSGVSASPLSLFGYAGQNSLQLQNSLLYGRTVTY